ncbi:MAG: hypothetical protein KME49_09665 [Brasilonema octagenarum HA4186-MV1]|jgi:hypothetical protein|uniref:hypothetical protein n=1 Tax=Brasilonema sennae TaxID=1397703 RepID=UPI00155AFA91|nr:hypothetical protein [Brasilonema sennae]MBW4625750.1 hypothetical protein [Brasilonema octagenarum HA4186-MV1]
MANATPYGERQSPDATFFNGGNPPQSPQRGEPPQGAALRTEVAPEGFPPAALDSPVPYGGKPSCSAGSLITSYCFIL